MYDRKIDDEIYEFEPSGALYHSALVMMDRQTDSFWAMMSGKAIGGPKQETPLIELPLAEKTTWADWRKRFPHTLVLKVDGKTHDQSNPYDNYFTSQKTFRPVLNPDNRLGQKDPVFTFWSKDKPFAAAYRDMAGGLVDKAAGEPVFLYREADDSIYRNTRAWRLSHAGKTVRLSRQEGKWTAKKLGVLDPNSGVFDTGAALEPLTGLDTFWYIWSTYHPKTGLLK